MRRRQRTSLLCLEAGMKEQFEAIDRITAEAAPATFENTIAVLERSGRTLGRVQAVYGTLCGTMSDEPLRAARRKCRQSWRPSTIAFIKTKSSSCELRRSMKLARVGPDPGAAATHVAHVHQLRRAVQSSTLPPSRSSLRLIKAGRTHDAVQPEPARL